MKKHFSVFFIVFVSFFVQSCGSYYYAERYKFGITEDVLIDKIKQFKSDNPQYKCIQVGDLGESYDPGIYHNPFGGDNSHSLTRTDISIDYVFYFYLPDIPATLFCLIRIDTLVRSDKESELLLEGIIYGNDTVFRGGWKTINNYKEITRKENRMIKKKFETEILDKLGVTWWHKSLW